jgi:predicted amidohydrolase YtcJ
MRNSSAISDLVVLNGKIITMDKKGSIVEAVLISGSRIAALGSITQIKPFITPTTRIIDLGGKTALPGFIDAHHHLQMASCTLGLMAQCHTPPNETIEEVIKRIQEWMPNVPSDRWVIGQGCLLQERKLKDQRFPNRYDLDKVSRDRPVVLRFGLHVTILNSKAIELLGIGKKTEPPKGAGIDLDPLTGDPTGVTRDFWNYIPFPNPDEEQVQQAVESNIRKYCLANGITSIHDLPETTLALKIYQKLMKNGNLPLRIRFYYEIPHMIKIDELLASGLSRDFGNDILRIGGIKIFVDGGLTSGLGYFHNSYANDKGNYGKLSVDPNDLEQYLIKANRAGLQVLMHTSGDKAADIALDAIEKAQNVYPRIDHRHRLEHMGNVCPDTDRFMRAKRLGALPVPNMGFINSWGDQIEHLLGTKRAASAFWCKRIIDEGFPMPGTSDATGTHPENANPFFCISCAINRKTFSGKVISPGERISMNEAIKMYTNYSAYAGFEENEKGSLEIKKLGDLIVVSENPWEVSDSSIAGIKVLCTVLGGEIMYNPAGF